MRLKTEKLCCVNGDCLMIWLEWLPSVWAMLMESTQHLQQEDRIIAQLSNNNKNINYIAVDLIDAMLGMAKRNVEAIYGIRQSTVAEKIEDEIEKQKIVKNLKITRYDISRIQDIFGEEDKIKRIYINFCNPWPKEGHKKRRLTHPRQLSQYAAILRGELHFKKVIFYAFTSICHPH